MQWFLHIMMIAMNILSKFQIDVSGNVMNLFGAGGTVLSMQNSFVYLTMFSFIVTYVAAFAGMKLAKNRGEHVEVLWNM